MAANVIINGVTYQSVPEVNIPLSGGGMAEFFDTGDATADAAHVLTGKTFYKSGGKANGAMPDNGGTGGTISQKTGTVTIPAGYTSGGSVSLSDAAKAQLVSGNIKSGATIMGVQGDPMVLDTTIASGGASAGKIMAGYKAYVNGALVNGDATVPTVSQDSSSKVLTIQ